MDILSSKDTYIKDLIIVKEPGKRYKGYVHYIFEIAEESRPSPFKYSEGLSHAIVNFKAKHAISIEGEFVDYAVNQHGKKLYSQIGKVR